MVEHVTPESGPELLHIDRREENVLNVHSMGDLTTDETEVTDEMYSGCVNIANTLSSKVDNSKKNSITDYFSRIDNKWNFIVDDLKLMERREQ